MLGIRISYCYECDQLVEIENYVLCLSGSVNRCIKCSNRELDPYVTSKYVPINHPDMRQDKLNDMLNGNFTLQYNYID